MSELVRESFKGFSVTVGFLDKGDGNVSDILREMMMEQIERKILDFQTEKEVYAYNAEQLQLILDKLNDGGELDEVEKRYLEIIFD